MKLTAVWLSAAALGMWAAGTASAAEPNAADKAAIFKASGFKANGGKYMRCEDDVTISYSPGRIEMEDLNGDGADEAWVKEGSTFCYGNTAEAFVLLTKSGAAWTVLLDEVGVPVTQTTKHNGWPDIEVGGPGFGKFPVYRYDGKKYVKK